MRRCAGRVEMRHVYAIDHEACVAGAQSMLKIDAVEGSFYSKICTITEPQLAQLNYL